VSLKTDGQAISGIVRLTDTGPYTSWKDGRWVFKQQNLYELSAKLARRYDVTFVFESEQLKDYIISGTLLDETLEQVLKTLQFIAPIDYIINHKTVTLKENQQLRKKYHDQNLINK
jgi:ferric-dicitrate binding protein FerR (iron transport regulator)